MIRRLTPCLSLALVAVTGICLLASGGEGMAVAGGDPSGVLFRLLCDSGMAGGFIIYLILQKRADLAQQEKDRADRKEQQEKERSQRIKDNERWHALDRELVALVKENTQVNSETVAALHLINAEMQRLTTSSGPTRVYHKE